MKILRTFAAGSVLAVVVMVCAGFGVMRVNNTGSPPTWFHPHDRVTQMANEGDARAILTLAQHGVERPVDPHYPHDTAYRWLRPLPIIFVFVFSGGQGWLMPYVMAVLAVLGAGLLSVAVGLLLRDEGVPMELGALVVLVPGAFAGLQWFSLDALGLGLALLGWRSGKTWLMVLGGLQHEVWLIPSLARRRLLPLAIFASWTALIWLVFGEPTTQGNLGLFGSYGFVLGSAKFAIATVLLGLIALTHPRYRLMACGYLLVMAAMGPWVSLFWMHFTRALMPLWIFGLLGLVRLVRSEHPEILEGHDPLRGPAPRTNRYPDLGGGHGVRDIRGGGGDPRHAIR